MYWVITKIRTLRFLRWQKSLGRWQKLAQKAKRRLLRKWPVLPINERILSFNFNYTGVFSSLCDKTVLYSVRNLCIELKVYSFSVKCCCARSSCQCSWLKNEQLMLRCSFSLRDSQSSMTLIPRKNLAQKKPFKKRRHLAIIVISRY